MNSYEKDKLLKKIQEEDFALYETVLFLDAHPNDSAALAYYKQRKETLEKCKHEYQQKFGPLTIYGNEDCSHWNWVNKPWPWEKEAN
ncbi:MAG: spore coat protein CotJB [Clostridia bacterium]|nr:spore coat protein CotJB [Clostridia bacterium]